MEIQSPAHGQTVTALVKVSGTASGTVQFSEDGVEWVTVGAAPSFQFTLNSYHSKDGLNHIHFRSLDDRGKELRRVKRSFIIDNVGRLSWAIRTLMISKVPKIILSPLDSSLFPQEEGNQIAAPWFDRLPENENLSPHFKSFVKDGFFILENLIAPELMARINRDVDAAVQEGASAEARIEHMFRRSQAVREVWAHPELLKLLSTLFEERALPCQTLNFVYGSTQEPHQDTIHLTSFPEGYMCGVWVALEDVSPDAGPLIVYPGSHRLPVIYANALSIPKVSGDWRAFEEAYHPKVQTLVEGIEPFYYTPKAGSVLVWHANLAHGGAPRRNRALTRKSMVSHYFAKGAVAYYDSTGQPAATTFLSL